MNLAFIDKKTVLLFGGLLVICIGLLVLAVSLLWQPPSSIQNVQQPTQQPNFIQSLFSSELRIVSVSPNNYVLLKPGKSFAFSVIFNKSVRLDNVSVSLSEHIIPTDQTNQLKVSLIQQNSDKVLLITPPTPVKPYASYILTISQENPAKRLLSQAYQTDIPIPSPVPQNNLMLKQYLPYETGTYALSYLESQNLYVFNFIYNPNDPTDVQTQFENAKTNAILYIKSKGIDPNAVTIDWRFH